MRKRLLSAIGAIVPVLLVGFACASLREIGARSPANERGDRMANDRVEELDLDLSDARSRETNLLSPSWFQRADEAHARAEALGRNAGSVREILSAVAAGEAALETAEANAIVAHTMLYDVMRARARALHAGAASLGEPFEAVEREVRDVAAEIEMGDGKEARASRESLTERYRRLEFEAIEQRTLADARKVLQRARDEGAQARVPTAYVAAEGQIDAAAAVLERQRYADAEMQKRAEAARFYAKRAFELNRAARAVETMGSEEVVLDRERRMRNIGAALGIADHRDWTFDKRRMAIESVASSLRDDRDFLVSQNERLREEVTGAREQITALAGENEYLERESDFNALFERARSHFSPEEAEVYRRGGQLVIRLRALDFPVGEAEIAPEDYALLAKVQRAIRTFGYPRVTIEGHTDSTGGFALNQRLSKERAEAVRDYLVANHVLPSHRIVAVGRASEDPLASNETPEGRALNRRIDVMVDTRRILFIAGVGRTAAP